MVFVLDAATQFCTDTAWIWQLIGNFVKILQWVILVLCFVWGLIDLAKAVVAGEEKEIKEAQTLLAKRFIYGLAAFLLIWGVKGIFGLVDSDASSSPCFKCVAKPTGAECDSWAEASK